MFVRKKRNKSGVVVDYLEKYNGVTLSVDALYRYLDKVHKYQIRQIQDIGYRHAVRVTGGKIQVVFLRRHHTVL